MERHRRLIEEGRHDAAEQVGGANRRWRWPFRWRGSRRESAVVQLSRLAADRMPLPFVSG
jgi:hypothetical protein